MTDVITVEELSKTYSSFRRKTQALDNVSLKVEQGVIFGLLGLNGSGKTTLIKSLLGLVHPQSGSFTLFGQKLTPHIRKKVGYLPENPLFSPVLTGREILKTLAKLSGVHSTDINKKSGELLEQMGIAHAADKPVKTYSKGMQQRLGIAQAIIHDPQLIIMDEPTDGVDPVGRKAIRDLLIKLKSQGKTVFINSHILSEVEIITDKVAVLNKGKLIKEGSVKGLTTSSDVFFVVMENPDQLNRIELKEKFNSAEFHTPTELIVTVDDSTMLNELIDFLRVQKIKITEIRHSKQSLEDVFINLLKPEQK